MSRKTEREQQAIELAKALSNYLNSFDKNYEAFVEQVTCREHRTLQQNTMRLVIDLLKGWAKAHDERDFDLRNEATCKIASEFFERFTEQELWLPIV